MEGASVTIAYVPEEEADARDAEAAIKAKVPGARVLLVPGDLRSEEACLILLQKHMETWRKLDALCVAPPSPWVED